MTTTTRDWTFDVGGISLALNGPAVWLDAIARAWTSWESQTDGWPVRLLQDSSLPIPEGPFFEARPHFVGEQCRLKAPGFDGQITFDAEKAARLRAHPAAEPGDLAYFIRTVFALQAFEQQAMLFHAAGVVHNGAAYAFFGHSGSGKTTAARLSQGKPVLNDDLLLLRPGSVGWKVWATPFGRRRAPEIRSAPLRALLRLVQAPEERLEPMPRGMALGELVANSPVINADPTRSVALLTRWEEILQTVPVNLLHFRKSAAFWEVIDAHFG